jgi:hypothetical protein
LGESCRTARDGSMQRVAGKRALSQLVSCLLVVSIDSYKMLHHALALLAIVAEGVVALVGWSIRKLRGSLESLR